MLFIMLSATWRLCRVLHPGVYTEVCILAFVSPSASWRLYRCPHPGVYTRIHILAFIPGPHAGVYIVWDSNSAYYIMGGGDPELRSSGATTLCMWEAIKFSASVTACFDFVLEF